MISDKEISSVFVCFRGEWKWLHFIEQEDQLDSECNCSDLFKTQFRQATKELLSTLGKFSDELHSFVEGIDFLLSFDREDLPESQLSTSRLYDGQVVEIRDDLSLIILLSNADEVNVVSTASNEHSSPFLFLPVNVFEIRKIVPIRQDA